MFGEDKESEEIFLEDSETHRNKFERNHMDRFKIESYDLGDLNAIRVRHDNSGVFPGWFLERVEITTENDKKYIFECNKWFSYNIDDGKIDRVIREIVISSNIFF
jgi:lipoxygenase homology domain-containing protein 1